MIDQLAKIMMLTTSDNDNEALAAVRKANTIMKVHRLTWEDVIAAKFYKPVGEDDMKKRHEQKAKAAGKVVVDPVMQEMISDLLDLEELYPNSREFVESLERGLHKYGTLTEKQQAALEKLHSKLCG